MSSRSVAEFAGAVTVAELERDPYPVYARLRREAPVCFIPAVGLWFVTRYDDVEFVASHPDLFTAEMDDSPVDRTFGSPTIITVDGELHHELRRTLDSKYRPRHVSTYIDSLVRPIASDLLDGLAGRDRAELMADYLEPPALPLKLSALRREPRRRPASQSERAPPARAIHRRLPRTIRPRTRSGDDLGGN
jgi:cytochrome P450